MLNYCRHNFGRVLVDFPWVCQRGGKVKGKGCDHTIKSSIVTKQANPSSFELPEEVSSQHCSSDKTGDWTISHLMTEGNLQDATGRTIGLGP